MQRPPIGFFVGHGLFGAIDDGGQDIIEIAHAFAVFGREGDGIAQAQGVGLYQSRRAGAAFALVGDDHRFLVAPAQPFGEVTVQGGNAGTGVDEQQGHIGAVEGAFGLGAHARLKDVAGDVFQAGGIDDGEFEVDQPRRSLAPVAGQAGRVVDECQPLAHEAVEKGRLTHIGAADDGHGDAHGPTACCCRLAVGYQRGVVGEKVDAAVGDDGIDDDPVRHLRLA